MEKEINRNVVEMSVHAGLSKLKKVEQRLNSKIFKSLFIGCKKISSDTVYNTGVSVREFNTSATADLESINALMSEYFLIKTAIIASNATTMVAVGNKVMSVAQAIEFKKFIEHKKSLLKQMKAGYKTAVSTLTIKNEKADADLDRQIEALGGKDSDLKEFINLSRQNNNWELIDPVNLKTQIDELEEEILDFESNVDIALSQSNALTKITIEL